MGGDHEVNEEREKKVLGITWNHETDELSIDLSHIVKSSENLPITKRTVLKVTARVYDPLGWISPILIGMKLVSKDLPEQRGLGRETESRLEGALYQVDVRVGESRQ